MCSFSSIFARFYREPDFVENMLGSFSCFYIEIAYLNFTFCGAYMLRFLAHHILSAKRGSCSIVRDLTKNIVLIQKEMDIIGFTVNSTAVWKFWFTSTGVALHLSGVHVQASYLSLGNLGNNFAWDKFTKWCIKMTTMGQCGVFMNPQNWQYWH